ncbi:GMC family oxidoreductase [Nostoc flagelliforme FACHB-838]|uniref:Cholesterol oxidase n=1 Tax=Nostoc flagelliforme FACHB-838 TaxID=2692904 RepID=A0ABR8DW10_9NOSO|nr:GMC oxidoreductase [Nostoc flagelliforme]MBD2533066.1 GMC family oxidoreductase [Nostoc flagelliforme FACHB-838]
MVNNLYRRRRFIQGAAFFGAGLAVSAGSPIYRTSATSNYEDTEALIIGSGFGGSIASLRLAQAGIQTLVLERGRRWNIRSDGNTFADFRNPDGRSAWLSPTNLFGQSVDVYTGVLETLNEDGVTVLAGAGVGGGSLVYNAIIYQPIRELFYRVFPRSISYKEMDEIYYPRVLSMLRAAPIPDDVLKTDYYEKTRFLLENGKKAGLPTRLLDLAVDWDIVRQEIRGEKISSAIQGDHWFGINSGAKNSLDRNYLLQAEQTGLVKVKPLHIVTEISELPRHGYRVKCNEIDERGEVIQSKSFTCRYLFLAAGSMGTSKLLLKAKEKGTLPKLKPSVGQNWNNNGDMVAQRSNLPKPVINTGGPSGCVVENINNTQNPISLMNLEDWSGGPGTQRCLTLAMTKPKGFFTYDPSTDGCKLHWPEQENRDNLLAAKVTYTTLDGSITTPTTTPKTDVSASICAHPLGGAVMGKVCDQYGRVFNYQGLYVVDGALIPGPTACTNPSFTIAAIAERCMEKIIAEDIYNKRYALQRNDNSQFVAARD